MKKLLITLLMLGLATSSISAGTISRKAQIIKTPQEAAKGLYQAWSRKSRRTAEKFARAEAIDKLFGVQRHSMVFKGCTEHGKFEYECIYQNKKLDLSFAMIVKSFRAGYRVASVSFSSEAI